MKSFGDKTLTRLLVGVLIVFSLALSGTTVLAKKGVGDYASGPAPSGRDALIPPGHYGLIASRADDVLLGNAPPTKFAAEVDAALESFFVVDIRSAGDYCKGHIPGAVNIPFRTVAMPANLEMLPTDIPILVVCYTGHTASQTTMLYRLLGYDAYALRYAMMSWVDVTRAPIWSSLEEYKQNIFGGNFELETCAP
jgi:rhodanese-related sulfurtransferase